MDRSAAIRRILGDQWIPAIYAEKVRSQRTRSFTLEVPVRENSAEIQYTLLGIELKIGKRRFSCPDLAAARYLRVFARLGIGDFAIPYDITKVSVVAAELETAWHKTLLVIDAETREFSGTGRLRCRNAVVRSIRTEIEEIGAGPLMPTFRTDIRKPR
jgi:hypothetical protein